MTGNEVVTGYKDPIIAIWSVMTINVIGWGKHLRIVSEPITISGLLVSIKLRKEARLARIF